MFIPNDALTYADEPYVQKNTFLTRKAEQAPLPTYDEVKDRLPCPVWEGHEDAISCYDKAWKIAFGNLRTPSKESGLISNFIDTAFNGFTFMWDSSFMVMFGKYAAAEFDFQKTLDNFYAKQHRDGFICREICETANGDQFYRHDPSSTGPNIMPWSEWEYFETTGNLQRLGEVYDPLMAYHRWLKNNRTWPNGGYWSTGWGCGMDNQPRVQTGYSAEFSHGYQIWADATIQQVISAKTLIRMANLLGRSDGVAELEEESKNLTNLINDTLWNDKEQFYFDLWRNGEHNHVKSIGAYWALLANLVPKERLDAFVAHLENENEFKRPHRVPTLSADHPAYRADGGYWCGGVWAPTTYMVLKGLRKNGYDNLAYDIACNHLENVVSVFRQTGTLWENYAPETATHGSPAKSDFVGWTGLTPIAVLMEYVFGICPNSAQKHIIWYINRHEKHGVMRYPFGGGFLNLLCESRKEGERPHVTVSGDVKVTLELRWENGSDTITYCPSGCV